MLGGGAIVVWRLWHRLVLRSNAQTGDALDLAR